MATFSVSTRVIRGLARLHQQQVLITTNGRLRRFSTAANDQKESTSQTEEPASELQSQLSKLQEEKDQLQKQIDDTQDKYKRSLAETENVRQRMKKQVDDAKLFGIQGFCKDLLEVADILGKATESVPKDQLTDDNPHLNSLFQGLTMTETQLQKVFTRHGLSVVNPSEGEKFDPHFHEALFQQPAGEGKADGTVFVVTKIGYKLHERTIRPALVGVYKAT